MGLTSPRRSAPGPAPTQGRSRSPSSRSGVMSPLPSLASLNQPSWNKVTTAMEHDSLSILEAAQMSKSLCHSRHNRKLNQGIIYNVIMTSRVLNFKGVYCNTKDFHLR